LKKEPKVRKQSVT
jgi:hypothetical protein